MLQIQLLGGFQTLHDGEPLEGLESGGLQTLLAYLVLNVDKPQHRRHVAFTFWPDSTEKHAFSNLRNHLHRLRSALPSPDRYLEADRTTIAWKPEAPTRVDVWQFERSYVAQDWADAVDLYEGDLLPGHYEEWILIERDSLRDRFLQAIEQLVEAQESAGQLRAAVATVRKLLRQDPLHEPSYRRLMRLYIMLGDRASAVAAYQTCVDVLRSELEAEVSADTQAAYDDLISADQPAVSIPRKEAQRPGHNLPAPLTDFIGRGEILEALSSRLQSSRLLTLTGPAGVGKTRLAQELARDQLNKFPDGVWWLELSSLTDSDQVISAAASTLGLRDQADEPLLKRLIEFLQPKDLLLTLDNCEHLVEAVQQLASDWLRQAPSLKMLLTSREPLHLPGEVVHPVEPLSLPPQDPDEVDEVAASEAGKLFLERANALLPTFNLDATNAASVAEICRRLDGIPLAIELAAGQVRSLSPLEIAARLDNALSVLTGGRPVAPERQHTLRGAVGWSFKLLPGAERALFRRLAVFSGGWTLQAAEHITADPLVQTQSILPEGQVLSTLSSLLEKSLVYVAGREEGTRYAMLEIVRQFAREKLKESGEERATKERHFKFYLRLARNSEKELVGPEQFTWLDQMRDEIDNFRAALETGLNPDHALDGLSLAVSLGRFWSRTDRFREGLHWIDAGLEDTAPEQDLDLFAQSQIVRARLLYGLGEYSAASKATGALRNQVEGYERANQWKHRARLLDARLDWRQGNYDQAISSLREASRFLLEHDDLIGAADAIHILGHVLLDRGRTRAAQQKFTESLQLYRELGDLIQIAALVGDLGLAAYFEDDFQSAEEHFREAQEIYHEAGYQDGMSRSFNRLGDVARSRDDYTRAEEMYRHSLELAQRIQFRAHIVSAQHNLGYCALARDDIKGAAQSFQRSLNVAEALEDRKGVVEVIAGLAAATADRGDAPHAVRLYAAAANLGVELGATVWPANLRETEPRLEMLRSALAEADFEQIWKQGESLTFEQALAETKELLSDLKA